GIEAWASWQATAWWRLGGGVYLQHRDLAFDPGTISAKTVAQAGDDPASHGFIRSTIYFSDHWSLFVDARAMDALPNPHVPGYVELNAHLDWRIDADVTLSLSGFNLLHAWHVEYPQSDRIPRALYVQAQVSY